MCFLSLSKENESPENDAVELIYANRIELYSFITNCKYKFGARLKPCNFNGKNYFLSLNNEPLSVWHKNKKEVFGAFLSSCGIVGWYDKNISFVINNELYFSILASLLKISSLDLKSYSDLALETLLNRTSFQLIKIHSNQIKEALQLNKSGFDNKLKLFSLLDLTKNEKEQILSEKYVPLEIRARLGDNLSEDTLINNFINEADYDKKSKYVKYLIYVGTDRCIKNIIINFNQPFFKVIKYKKSDSCISESIRYPVLIGFRQIFPENALFNARLQEFNPFFNGFNRPEEVTRYLNEFKFWAKSKYGVEPVDPDPTPVIKGFCKIY